MYNEYMNLINNIRQKLSFALAGLAMSAGVTLAQELPNDSEPDFSRINSILETPLIDLPDEIQEPHQCIENAIDVIVAWSKANDKNPVDGLSALQHKIENSYNFSEDNPVFLNDPTKKILLKEFLQAIIGESPNSYLGRCDIKIQKPLGRDHA